MKPKTQNKLIKRELLKPLHHIDTCIIIGSTKETKLGFYCKKYLKLIGYKYRGCFSLPVMGELLIKTHITVKEEIEKELFFRWMSEFINYRGVSFYTLKNLILPHELTTIDKRVNGTDALILACAVEEKAVLVTLDKDLLNNKKIEGKYKIKIRHPKELI
ncbi:MAG: PIN domain-containing protein [Candidatus Aenigmarchaeota archaeon]|nr:PIN domain-containing protein [Candidatus Aenigmarchaeota archaeon]